MDASVSLVAGECLQTRGNMACHRDPALGEMYALVRSQGLLEGRLRALAHQVSDANLQQMPDFQQRVEVLRQLDYIAPDNTVQLKVSVATWYFVSKIAVVVTILIVLIVVCCLAWDKLRSLLAEIATLRETRCEDSANPVESVDRRLLLCASSKRMTSTGVLNASKRALMGVRPSLRLCKGHLS